MTAPTARKPAWLKAPLPKGATYRSVREAVSRHGLHTVCQEAHCPNLGECWNAGTATFLILGDTCTRGCGFCAVHRGDPEERLDPAEPARVASAASAMGLSYVVITSVTRDDLPDGGADAFARTVEAVRGLETAPLVEVLIPDYLGAPLRRVVEAAPQVLAHNVEVVERLGPRLRHGLFDYRRSLRVLREAGSLDGSLIIKSSILLGLGETRDEVERTMDDLREAGVGILVLGQYLSPSAAHEPVHEYLPPARFDKLAEAGRGKGFDFVAAGPLVRTSYRAAEAYAAKRCRTAGPSVP